MRGNIVDDCLQPVIGASVRFKLQSGSNIYYCPSSGYVTNETGNFYNCTWDSSGKAGGWYNVTMESSKDYYINGSYTRENAFFLITPVVLSNPQVSYPGDGSWGELHNFSVIVNHYADVNVCLLERISPSDPWSVTECKFVSSPNNKLVNFTRYYTCSDYQTASLRYFAFNASEPGVPETYSETSPQTHVLTKDDIAFNYVLGNESSVNRNGSYTTKFVLRVNDTDRNQPAYTILGALTKPQVWFKIHNGTDYITDGSNTTNSSGYVEYNFDPTCSYDAGKRSWYAYTSADSCYKDASSSIFNVTIVGELIPNVTFPDGQTYYRELYLYIPIYGNVVDECNLHNITNALVNFTAISVGFGNQFECLPVNDLNNGTYNCTFNATDVPEGWYNVRMNATNVTYYNSGTSLKQSSFRIIHIWQPPVLELSLIHTENDWGWGENLTFKVNVSDVNAEDVNVSLWLSSDNQTWSYVDSKICYNCGAKTELTFYYKGFSCSDIGTKYFKFNASDAHNTTCLLYTSDAADE